MKFPISIAFLLAAMFMFEHQPSILAEMPQPHQPLNQVLMNVAHSPRQNMLHTIVKRSSCKNQECYNNCAKTETTDAARKECAGMCDCTFVPSGK